jgi:glyoxylase-like metal-dependent hydrolase (beta-lactamase superfamily II)
MARPPYTRGLHEVGDGLFAYLQPEPGWGWSNAGLVAGDGASLLVDTLYDLRLTREMLDAMRPITDTRPLDTLLNTHANGDHCYGNQLVPDGARIYASEAAAAEMGELPPQALHALVQADLGPELTPFVRDVFGPFRFDDIELRPPTDTFSGRLSLTVGGRTVELIEVGPAHTAGDVLAHVPEASTVFTGDILFMDGTPVVWSNLPNWIEACEVLRSLGADTLVPGHGPVCGVEGADRVERYLRHVREQAAPRFAAGMEPMEAAFDADLGEFADWDRAERIVLNMDAAYRELDPSREPANPVELFGGMARYVQGKRPEPAG